MFRDRLDRDEDTGDATIITRGLRAKIRRQQDLVAKYRRADKIQKALLEISNAAIKASSLSEFYSFLHQQLNNVIAADNFYIATYDPVSREFAIPFFADEKDSHPAELYPDQDLNQLLSKGMTGYVFRTRRSLLADNQIYQQLLAAGEVIGLGSDCHQWLGVPILSNNVTTGVLTVQSYDDNIRYSEVEVELLEFISQHISGVLDRLAQQEQLERAISQRTRELSQAYDKLKGEVADRRKAEALQKSLYEIANLAAAKLDDTAFYRQIHRVLNHLLPASNCYIGLLDEDSGNISFPFYMSQQGTSYPEPRSRQDGLTEYLLGQRRPLMLDNADIRRLIKEGKLYHQSPKLNHTEDIHQWIGVPLFIQGKVMGVLAIYSFNERHSFAQGDMELLTFVSQHIATAIERKLSAQSLHHSYEQLEIMVTARTRELAHTNLELEKEIQQRRKVEQQLLYDANHDGLTGLPNRAMFMERLEQACKHLRRHTQDKFAVLFIDLDRFKLINDTLGHLEGDRFLIQTAKRLKTCIRDCDTLGRLGGDEFVILLDSIGNRDDVHDICKRVLSELAKPYQLDSQQFRSGGSIGVAIASAQDNSESILKSADNAMYQAKAKGKGCYVIYDPKSPANNTADSGLGDALRLALLRQEIGIQYLPVYDLARMKLVALEARAYWQHPVKGKLHQNRLRDIAEQAHLERELDWLTLDLISQEYAQLSRIYHTPKLQLTISSIHGKKRESLELLHKRLASSQCPAADLWLMFHEKALVQDTENHINMFDSLSKLGVNLGLYSYGTSYSSLSSLTFMPIKAIKLDASFATHLDSSHHYRLAKASCLAASVLGLQVFATGIEDTEAHRQFIEMGVPFGQGPLLGSSIEMPPARKSA
ncbi:diguanylate cyclase domain-containing protein [Shewanella sp. GXUN23E]|uniref:diguanylate cyclase domain-containing protein n=1 Tax=Shewanella sp. GXUN23E TaxID=3422498 RepID=UPI003D7F0BA1